MDTGRALREARRAADLSQRGLAQRSGIGLRTVAGIESGERQPTAALLARLLDACGQQLAVQAHAERPPDACRHLRAHLGHSLTERWQAATRLTGQHGALLEALQDLSGDVVLEAPGAVPVWVPGAPLELPLVVDAHVWPSARARPAPDPRLVVVRTRTAPLPPGLVRVRSQHVADVHVLPPDVLARQHDCRTWRTALGAAAALLDADRGRDAAGRRAPPHRQPDEDEEARRLAHSLRYLGLPRPTARDSRALRLDAPVSLPQWLAVRGMPPLTG